MKRTNYRHAPARPIACGGASLPLLLMMPALLLLGLAVHLLEVTS